MRLHNTYVTPPSKALSLPIPFYPTPAGIQSTEPARKARPGLPGAAMAGAGPPRTPSPDVATARPPASHPLRAPKPSLSFSYRESAPSLRPSGTAATPPLLRMCLGPQGRGAPPPRGPRRRGDRNGSRAAGTAPPPASGRTHTGCGRSGRAPHKDGGRRLSPRPARPLAGEGCPAERWPPRVVLTR